MSDYIIRAEDLCKYYENGNRLIKAIDNITLDIFRGEIISITGSSGSGKSTLLHLLSGLDRSTSGICMVEGIAWSQMENSLKDTWRNKYLGVIYQNHNLIPELSAIDNVAIPLWIQGISIEESKEIAKELLAKLKMQHRLNSMPTTLSGGEKQRVAIARAIITKPKCILADEPTGNLDSQMSFDIFQLLCELREKIGTTIILATHDLLLSKNTDRIIKLKDGQIIN